MTPADDFKVGDTVSLKSGSPRMTIDSLRLESGEVEVVFASSQGYLRKEKIKMECLTRNFVPIST